MLSNPRKVKHVYPKLSDFRFSRRGIKEYIKICRAIINQKRCLKKIKAINSVKTVLFFVVHESVWKLESLYELMDKSPNFNPVIIICPYISMGDEVMNRDLKKSFSYFDERGYTVVFGIKDGKPIDFKKIYKPDLIFYSIPHSITHRSFLPRNNIDILSAYVPYSHQISKYDDYKAQYSQLSHNLMWKIFTTNELDKKIFQKYSERRASNVEITGYPGIEGLLVKNPDKKSVWKQPNKTKIIFAPHHTIENDSPLAYSTFLYFGLFIKELAIKYAEDINFAFKPHPLLKDKLKTIWGDKETDDYYDFWENSENTQLELSEYIDLFNQSDAIIHDSGSFLAEYLYVNKPSMYLTTEKGINESKYNPFGLLCMDNYEKGFNQFQIEAFIQRVIAKEDLNQLKREQFVKQYCHFDIRPSQKIFDYIQSQLIS